jgi:hypothetical protein
MQHQGLHTRSEEHNIGAATIAVFAALAIATIVWPGLGEVLNTIFLIVAIALGLGAIGFVVWFFELHPQRWSRHNHQLNAITTDAPTTHPVLNGRPLTANLPSVHPARAYHGGGPG